MSAKIVQGPGPLPTVKIVQEGVVARSMNFYLDGMRVRGLRAVTMEWQIDGAAEVTLTIMVDRLEIDAPSLVRLRAMLDNPAIVVTEGDQS